MNEAREVGGLGSSKRRLAALGCALVCAVAPLAQGVQAQPAAPKAVVMGDPARRDVQVADTVPNLSGMWLSLSSNRTIAPMDGGPTPFLPWAQKFFEARAKAEATGMPLFDPNASCLPSGIPRAVSIPYSIEIVQTPLDTMISLEVMHSFRIVHMDGKPRPADWKPSYLGYSTGHWEGDTLVVETTGMNGYTQVDEEGRPKSTGIKVTERYQKRAPDILEVTFIVDDPKTYSRPWTARAQFKWAPEARQNEYICEENNRNKPDASGKLRHGHG